MLLQSIVQKSRFHKWLPTQCIKNYTQSAKNKPRFTMTGHQTSVSKGDIPPRNVYLLPRPKYGGKHFITLLTGTSILGQQGASYITSLLSSARVPIELENICIADHTTYFNSVLRNRTAVHIDIQHGDKEKRKAMKISNMLDLYVMIVKMRTFPGFSCLFPDVDILLIGQNNMGDFSKLEYVPVPGVVENLRVITNESIERFWHFTLKYVKNNKRKRIAIVHKCFEQPKSDGRFLEIAQRIQTENYPDIEIEPIDVDHCVAQLIINPKGFDVICANDRYCSFIATICSSVCGGANLFSAMEIGDHHAVFKPLQTKLSLTNFSYISPYGIISTCVDLLNYLKLNNCAKALWNEMLRTMNDGIKTVEYGGKDTGSYVICNIMNRLLCKATEEKSEK